MITKVIHQIWIGPHDPPQDWMDSWRLPGWEYQLWREPEIDALGLRKRWIYDRYYAEGRWHGAVNVARVEVLAEHGGVYIDADTEMLAPLDDAPWMETEMWAVTSANDPKRLANGMMGCAAGAEGMRAYRSALGSVRRYDPRVSRRLNPSWRRTGSILLTRLAARHPVKWVPAGTLFPFDKHGKLIPYDGKRYGRHHWGTTHGWWPPQ